MSLSISFALNFIEDVDYEDVVMNEKDVVMNENMAYDLPKECSRDSTGSVIYETIN